MADDIHHDSELDQLLEIAYNIPLAVQLVVQLQPLRGVRPPWSTGNMKKLPF
jgi:hypothetical protein